MSTDRSLSHFLDHAAPEWSAAWTALAARTGDADMAAECPDTGEAWQYMGTVWVEEPIPLALPLGSPPYIGGRGWYHEFRHRHHPKTQARRYERVRASDNYQFGGRHQLSIQAPPPRLVAPPPCIDEQEYDETFGL